MKTSLNLDDSVYDAAVAEARRTGGTISDTISRWARMGSKLARQQQRRPARRLQPVDLGARSINLDSRRDWMDELDER